MKRRSLRDLLPFSRKKSNADKIERYLERCFGHPIISVSSILRDFTSVQRDEDALLTSQHTATTLISTIHSINRKSDAIKPIELSTVTINDPSSSSSTVPIVAPVILKQVITEFEEKKQPQHKIISSQPVELKDFKLLQVLGKGCMGKVNRFYMMSY